jgi:autotransporter-associated beta strand protein
MKNKTLGYLLLPAMLAAGNARAQVIKGNNTIDLATAGSWTTAAPTSSQIATWDSTVTTANTSTLGTSATWAGINILNPGGNVGITIGDGRALSIGTSGINMSNATVDLTIGRASSGILRPTGSSISNYTVPSGRTLTINAIFQATTGTTTVGFNGAGTVNMNRLGGNATAPTSLILTNNGTGTVNYGGNATSGVFQINATGAGASVVVNGPALTVTQASTIGTNSNAGKVELQSGALNYNAGITLANFDGQLLKVSGGAFTSTNVNIGRTSNLGLTNAPLTSGFVVTGGTANLSGNLNVGTSNSAATARVDGGALTITGTANVGNITTANRTSTLQVSSGSLDVNGTDGVQLSVNTGIANLSQFLLTGGNTTVQAIKYGVAASAAGSRGDVIVNNGASLYVGSGGVSVVSANAYTANFTLTDATLGAKANWSSSVPITLAGNATIRAADASNTPFNISLSGALSGVGANLNKTGGGTLTLSGNNTYSGNTTINGGILQVDGALGATAVTLNSGTLKVGASGSISSATISINGGSFDATALVGGYTVASGQTLKGTGTFDGKVIVGSGATLAPGNSPGVTTFSGDLTLAGTTVMEIDGTTRGTQYDGVNLSGTAANNLVYGGELSLAFGAIPSANVYDLFKIDSVIQSSTFGAVTIGGTAVASSTAASITGAGWTASLTDTNAAVWDLSFDNASGDLTITVGAPIPEPSSFAILAGLAGLSLATMRRRSASALQNRRAV